MAHVFSPAEHYVQAGKLLDERYRDCRDCPANCAHEQAAVAAAQVHAILANVPGTLAAVAAALPDRG